ncbi:hypothetical protein Taro_053484 [Colocasia esculenta]|uniref:Uncharacterized protein n=1 Tax=Colocasia esculenta TaxID=4460 RepID=A0A843XL96_COLES|nr:hypothetical protein [Colocasia esculenta]
MSGLSLAYNNLRYFSRTTLSTTFHASHERNTNTGGTPVLRELKREETTQGFAASGRWDSSPKFDRGVPALKVAPGFPVKLKVQREYVSVQSTKHGKIRQHKVLGPSIKHKYKEQARERTPKLCAAVFYWAKLQGNGAGFQQHLRHRHFTNEGVGGGIYRKFLPPPSIG